MTFAFGSGFISPVRKTNKISRQVKITASRVNGFLLQPGPEIASILLFGPDQGLVRERAEILALNVVDDLSDPFRVAELTGAAIKSDPPLLADEAAQLSMTGGRRVIRVVYATDGISENLKDFLGTATEKATGGNLVIVEAGNLGPRSSLRKLFEKAGNGASIGCYEDDARELQGVIGETLGRYGLRPTPDALSFLIHNLGCNRLVTRGELEKLALYAGGTATEKATGGNQATATVTLEDAMASIGDNAAVSLDSVVYATASGNVGALDRALDRALQEGTTTVAMVRALGQHLQKLHLVLGLIEEGASPDKAFAALKPAIIFKFKDEFQAQVRRWRVDRLGAALALLTEAEADCKSTGFPAVAGCHRALIRLAQMATHGQRAA